MFLRCRRRLWSFVWLSYPCSMFLVLLYSTSDQDQDKEKMMRNFAVVSGVAVASLLLNRPWSLLLLLLSFGR